MIHQTPVGRSLHRIPPEFEGATVWILAIEPPVFALGIEKKAELDMLYWQDSYDELSRMSYINAVVSWDSAYLVRAPDFDVEVLDVLSFNRSGRKIVSREHFDEPRTLGSFFYVGGERE